jgi:diguanylate cyclase (GGDEF)-like protein
MAEDDSKLQVISSVAEVRGLKPIQAARALPTKVSGVITFSDQAYHQLWLQDQSGGIYIKYSGDHPDLQAGKHVTVFGITNPGDYAPVIVAPKFMVLGGGSFPKPVSVRPDLAASGQIESAFVEMEGLVHLTHFEDNPDHPLVTFEMFTEFGQVHVVTASIFSNLNQVRSLEDAKVRIRGVFGITFNSRRQMIGYQLLVADPSEIEVIEPAVPHPFESERSPIQSLLSFSSRSQYGHRVRVEGTVTLVERDFLYLQDSSGGVELRGDTTSIHVGDHVNALGYPTLVGHYSPIMTDAIFNVRGHDGLVTPKMTTAESTLNGHDDSMLVTIEGKLMMSLEGPGRKSLVIQSGVQTFTAQLDTTNVGSPPWQLREGSVLRLTGVCSMLADPNQLYKLAQVKPADFQLHLRSPEDLVVIKPPPFWSLQRTFVVLGVLSILIVLSLVWVGRLRKRVHIQVAALQKADETAQAVRDLSRAMQNVSNEERLGTEVPVQGSEDIAQLIVGFNIMIGELRLKEIAKQEAEAKLQQMALFDQMTNLPNRRLFFDRLNQCIARARREKHFLALLFIDLDGFKLVNDNLGHAAGDALLCEVANRLRAGIREIDTVARIGGDEFSVILDHIQENDDANRVAENLLHALRSPFQIEGQSVQISASIGISIFPDHGDDGGYLLQKADLAMYAAKKTGKNRVVQFDDCLGFAASEHITLESDHRLLHK